MARTYDVEANRHFIIHDEREPGVFERWAVVQCEKDGVKLNNYYCHYTCNDTNTGSGMSMHVGGYFDSVEKCGSFINNIAAQMTRQELEKEYWVRILYQEWLKQYGVMPEEPSVVVKGEEEFKAKIRALRAREATG